MFYKFIYFYCFSLCLSLRMSLWLSLWLSFCLSLWLWLYLVFVFVSASFDSKERLKERNVRPTCFMACRCNSDSMSMSFKVQFIKVFQFPFLLSCALLVERTNGVSQFRIWKWGIHCLSQRQGYHPVKLFQVSRKVTAFTTLSLWTVFVVELSYKCWFRELFGEVCWVVVVVNARRSAGRLGALTRSHREAPWPLPTIIHRVCAELQ